MKLYVALVWDWFQSVIAGIDGRRPYHDDVGDNLSFVVESDHDLVDSAWAT